MIILEMKNVSKTFKNSVKSLDNFNMRVSEGAIFGFVGPNGAGKSTAINILAGLVSRDFGEIFINEEKIEDDNYLYKRNTGFLLEKFLIPGKLTSREYLELATLLHGLDRAVAKKRIDELLEILELNNQKKWIETYSSGMKKKMALAAALLHYPRLLILDEPLEGIDPVSSHHIIDILKNMRNKGVTTLLSSHNLFLVKEICDEIAIINKGKIVFQSHTNQITNKIKNEINEETYHSLEEVFIDMTVEKDQKQKPELSWIV